MLSKLKQQIVRYSHLLYKSHIFSADICSQFKICHPNSNVVTNLLATHARYTCTCTCSRTCWLRYDIGRQLVLNGMTETFVRVREETESVAVVLTKIAYLISGNRITTIQVGKLLLNS